MLGQIIRVRSFVFTSLVMKCTSLKCNQCKKRRLTHQQFLQLSCVCLSSSRHDRGHRIYFYTLEYRCASKLWCALGKKSLKTIVEWYPVSYQTPEFITTAKGSHVSVQASIGSQYKKNLSAVVLYVCYSLLL